MFERMLDKSKEPSVDEIRDYIGEESYERLCRLETILSKTYDLSKILRFPFGNKYGWGYKLSHRSFHLCYVFFEKDAFNVMIQIGDVQLPEAEAIIAGLSPKAQELWAKRYPCGDHGGWVHYRVLEDVELDDVISLIHAKKAPKLEKEKTIWK